MQKYPIYISIQPLSQYLVEAPLAVITASSLLGYVFISFTHLDLAIFLPFFLADLLKHCQFGWGASVHSNLQVFPQILKGIQVWALAGPLKDFHILVLKPFPCCFGCILGVIVLLERKSSLQSNVFCTLKQVLLKDLPVFGSFHCSLYPYKFPSPCP